MLRLPVIWTSAIIFLLIAGLIMAVSAACGSESTDTATTQPEPAATSAPVAQSTAAPAPTQATAATTTEGHQPTVPPDPAATPEIAPPVDPATAAPAATATGETERATYAPVRDGEELTVILATTILEEGTQRVAFLLTTQTGLVKDSEVVFTPVYLPDNQAGQEIATRFNEWPYGTRGTFAAEVGFDRPGAWRLDISAAGPDATGWGTAELEVAESSPLPALGSASPLSENKTLSAFGDLALVTTDYSPDEALYQVTIREAVESPLPAVVVFASPAFCTSATCGPQVDAVSELRAKYQGQANFIHVEIYDNPDEIQGDLSRARIAPTVDEWGLSQLPHWINESWTFVLDPQGRILSRFEGFATVTELEESLLSTLN